MKKTSKPKPAPADSDELSPDYDFDYAKAKPNRFATHHQTGAVAVVLDPDVAEVFTDSNSVNAVSRPHANHARATAIIHNKLRTKPASIPHQSLRA